jgi:hypothetical protein
VTAPVRSSVSCDAAQRPGVMIPSRRQRLPLEAPLVRLVVSAGIIGIGWTSARS